MNSFNIANKLHKNLKLAELYIKHYSPEILLFLGIASGIAGAVSACTKAQKTQDILKESKNEIDAIHRLKNIDENYNETEERNDLIKCYSSTAMSLAKTYATPVSLGVISVSSILMAHGLLSKRAAGYAAAFTATNLELNKYRKSIVERFGKETDNELYYGTAKETKTVTKVNENGETVEETVEYNVATRMCNNGYSSFARCFDETNDYWVSDATYNLNFIKRAEQLANEKLVRDGYLYLNDVYHMLGFPRTLAGQVSGWIYDEDYPVGDNCVCFNVYDINNESKIEFLNGKEKSIWLDFNIDGNIWELMCMTGVNSKGTGNPMQDALDI